MHLKSDKKIRLRNLFRRESIFKHNVHYKRPRMVEHLLKDKYIINNNKINMNIINFVLSLFVHVLEASVFVFKIGKKYLVYFSYH